MSLDVNFSEPDEFNCLELHSVLEDVAKLKGIANFNYHVDSIGGKGGYIANTFRVVIRDSENEDNKFTVIVKTLVNTERQEMFHELHKREVNVYKEIVSMFNNIQAEIDYEKLVLPEYLLSCDEKGKEILILNDLKHEGWMSDDTFEKYENLEYNTVKLVLMGLAKLHALSFVFQHKYPDKFNSLKKGFEDIIFQEKFLNKSKLRHYFQDSFDASVSFVEDADAKKSLDLIRPKLLYVLRDFTKTHERSVMCHGDCWINNMLFKFKENNATEVCFLDFQAVRYASPVTDIIYFIYLCTNPQFRSEYLEKLKIDYYDTLKSVLRLYAIDVSLVFPLEEFENELDAAKQYGLLIAMIDLKLIILSREEDAILKGAGTDHESALTKVPGEEELLKIKVNEVVKEAYESGHLEKLCERVKHLNT